MCLMEFYTLRDISDQEVADEKEFYPHLSDSNIRHLLQRKHQYPYTQQQSRELCKTYNNTNEGIEFYQLTRTYKTE